jgi:hypothetical protein
MTKALNTCQLPITGFERRRIVVVGQVELQAVARRHGPEHQDFHLAQADDTIR